MRVAILWMQLAGYTSACFRALADEGAELHVVFREPYADAPFEDDRLSEGFAGHHWGRAPDQARLQREIDSFSPDAVLVSSWNVGAYRRVARSLRGRSLRVLCMDNSWLATPKQWAGILVSPFTLRPTYDLAFLPGERQVAFAHRLGFGDERILWGLYSCDYDAFAAPLPEDPPGTPPCFVFVGRLVESKGTGVLARAYARYRELVAEPWPLLICGAGPLAGALGQTPGVDLLGFVQPADLPALFHRSTCLVLPSTFEPWGVVVHEAAAAGLAVICTTACGAGTRLVLDGFNGAVVPPGDAPALAAAMADISQLEPATLLAMRRRSQHLAEQFTPQRWAQYLLRGIDRHRRSLGLGLAPK